MALLVPAAFLGTALAFHFTGGQSPKVTAFADRSLTPGAVFPGVTASDVCTPGWASAHRDVTLAKKIEVERRYHVVYVPHKYEIDHLIALELGGNNDLTNLWPQPLTQAVYKDDHYEDALHADVCSHRKTLRQAWAIIRRRYVR